MEKRSPKFLIYKSSGGLGHNLTALSRAINFAKLTNRELIIDTSQHGAFEIKFSTIFKTNFPYHEDYEIIPKNLLYRGISLDTISKTGSTYEQGGHYTIFGHNVTILDANNIEDIMIYSGCGRGSNINKSLEINETILNMLKKEGVIAGDYISVHFRNTDKKNNVTPFIKKVREIVNATNIKTIYLASDDYNAFDIFKKRFPKRKIIRKTVPPPNITNLHYTSENKFKQLYDSIVDIYYITKSSYFIPSYNSGFSRLIIDLINGKNSLMPIKKTPKII